MDRRAGVWFERLDRWEAELCALRAILREEGLEETFKWRGPCYVAHRGNVATLWSMKDAAGLGFFKGVLLDDPAGVLAAPGPNSRSSRVFRTTDMATIRAAEADLRRMVREAAENERRGLRPDMPPDDLDLPEELTDRFDADPAFREAWDALTPGRRRGYVIHFARAKKSETRTRRIDAQVDRIAEGKGMHDR